MGFSRDVCVFCLMLFCSLCSRRLTGIAVGAHREDAPGSCAGGKLRTDSQHALARVPAGRGWVSSVALLQGETDLQPAPHYLAVVGLRLHQQQPRGQVQALYSQCVA